MHFIKLNLFFILMSNSGLYALNKDVLVHLISTVSADKDKVIKELKSKYRHLINQSMKFGSIEMMECNICNHIDLVDVSKDSTDIVMCDYCGNTYHYKCKLICFNCFQCSDCIDESFHKHNDAKYCDSCNELLYKK